MPLSIPIPAVLVFAVLFGLSVVGNLYQYHEHDKLIAVAATEKQVSRQASDAAKECSDSVGSLAKQNALQGAAVQSRLDALAPEILRNQKAAIAALQAKPDNPQDLCGSVLRFLQGKVKEERGAP